MSAHRHGTPPSPGSVEAELLARTRRILDDWRGGEEEALRRFLAHCTPDVSGFASDVSGLAVPEGSAGPETFARRVFGDARAGARVDTRWCRARALTPAVGLVEGEVVIRRPRGEEPETPLAARLSLVFRRVPAGWLVAHWHVSRPAPKSSSPERPPEACALEALRERNRELERLAAARAAEIETARQQLVRQERLASLGQLTAGIAHEIKNPLNFVNNFSSLSAELVMELEEALRAGDDEEIRAILADLRLNVEKIEEHGHRVDAIVQSMMAHARSGEGTRASVEVNALVEEHVQLAYHGKRAQTPGLSIEVERDYDVDAGTLELVPQDVGRVVLNLVTNAFDALEEHAAHRDGSYVPTVHVSTRRVGAAPEEPGGSEARVEIRVTDNGPGIPEPVRVRIFEPFFTTKPTGKGTGLGLSMSHDIVVQGHGGTLEVESAPGEGAAFVVTLPSARRTSAVSDTTG